MERSKTDPDAFISTLPEHIRPEIAKLDKEISKVMKGEARVLWSGVFWGGSEQNIIGYGDHTYVRPGKKSVDWFEIGLAAQKNYISIYVNAVEGNEYVAEKYGNELGKVKIGKSSISFKRLADIDLNKLCDVIARARAAMRQ